MNIDMQSSFLGPSVPDLSYLVQNGSLVPDGAQVFRELIYSYYTLYGRKFPWRATDNPYNIFVSEIMLQQTQTYRVEPIYELFIKELPDFHSLAAASNREVIRLWQGLGYNRRALNVQKTAQRIIDQYDGQFPNDPKIAVSFPGIGPATAASICVFAFNRPTVFIETNIRAVFIHLFFGHQLQVHDKDIVPLVEQTVDGPNCRHWYYALMDYGVMLKKLYKNPARKSAHYAVQSKFEGSHRQVRGHILRLLSQCSKLSSDQLLSLLQKDLNCAQEKAIAALEQLCAENLVRQRDGYYFL